MTIIIASLSLLCIDNSNSRMITNYVVQIYPLRTMNYFTEVGGGMCQGSEQSKGVGLVSSKGHTFISTLDRRKGTLFAQMWMVQAI